MSRRRAVAVLLLSAGAAAHADVPVEAGPDVDAGLSAPKQRPLWELGIGVSGLRLPDYRGSDQGHAYLLPFPYIVYRGTWLKADRDGARALLFDSPDAKLDLSFGASAPTRGNNLAREGMPDLPGNAEVGPSLNVTLDRSPKKRWRLDLRMPLRAAVTLQHSPRYVGLTFSPNLNLDVTGADGGWNIGLLTGPLFADRKYHAQYYGVDPAYATPQRPAYSARGGYAGWQTLASTSRRVGNTWLGGFVRYENLSGAVYEDSPLVRRKSALTLGFAVSWILTTSSETVSSSE
ncbi:MAG TPA: MipA/OmpV family protein [Rhizobacter sp.]|nr:MipA/OmpV family protein [Rhizobacter sp.]